MTAFCQYKSSSGLTEDVLVGHRGKRFVGRDPIKTYTPDNSLGNLHHIMDFNFSLLSLCRCKVLLEYACPTGHPISVVLPLYLQRRQHRPS